MEVKDILKTAILFLNKEELLEDSLFLESVGEGYVPDLSRTNEINKLVDCLNLAYQEIVCEYLPLYIEEEIEINSNILPYTNLSETILEVISIKSSRNLRVKFQVFPNYILLDGEYDTIKIKYSYEPENLTAQSNISSFGGKLSKRVLAYGIAMEYCFISTLSDEAYIWEVRYKQSLKNIVRKKYDLNLPKRRWV